MNDPDRIAFFLLKPVARACKEFELLAEGDRVAVAISGGKDSRALLDLLLRYRTRVPFSYELVALHVAGTSAGFPELRPELEPWFRELGVAYHFAPLELPQDEPLPLDCHRCSWNRRKALFTAAAELGCGKLAFGHHADDAAATTLLNLMYGRQLETMLPRREFFDEKVTVIRPLIYVPEKELARYTKAAGFPDPPPLCPQGLTSKRAQIKTLLQHFGRDQKQIRTNLWRAVRRAMEF
ncbi:MAG: tRNA 2-thiocytidine biosynthesis protein TtcA [Anaerolineae bacterium]|nr:tRNA 2-thiocytidine biosynthesis protein TtcA [Anaerolineae bacterium]